METTPRGRTGLLSLPTLAVLLALAAVVAALVRLPAAIGNFDDRAAFNASRDALERKIAGADAEDIDNTFLVQALALVPSDARYALVLSQSPEIAASYGISAPTFNALPGFVQNVLLPRREVDPEHAQYLLCYACDTDPYDPRMQRLWQDEHGLVIGKLTG